MPDPHRIAPRDPFYKWAFWLCVGITTLAWARLDLLPNWLAPNLSFALVETWQGLGTWLNRPTPVDWFIWGAVMALFSLLSVVCLALYFIPNLVRSRRHQWLFGHWTSEVIDLKAAKADLLSESESDHRSV